MKPRGYLWLALALLCWLAAFLLTAREITRFRAAQALLPPGSTLDGVPVGGLTPAAAAERVTAAYTQTPLSITVEGNSVQVDPGKAGLALDAAAALDSAQSTQDDLAAFWDFLLHRPAAPVTLDLPCRVDETALRGWLETELAPRYNQPASPARITPGDSAFQPGAPGQALDLPAAQANIAAALCDLRRPPVDVPLIDLPAPRPTPAQLAAGLEAIVQTSGFDGVIEVYAQDLATGAEVSFAYDRQQAVAPGVAFTAASTIKIPVLVSAFRRAEGALDPAIQQALVEMIDLSDNNSTDRVMQTMLDPNLAPIQVTEDARALGLPNTFLAGFFYPGAPLLDRFRTPANARTDVTTEPDVYNQTTPAEMGRLLADIQRCAAGTENALVETFPGQLSQQECQQMMGLLEANRKAVLIEAGLPEGTRMGHKYGWVTDPADGLMHQASDAAVVTLPQGAFVLAIYLYHPDQLQWEPAVALNARLAALMVNYYSTSAN